MMKIALSAILVISILVLIINAKILRVGHHFEARFTLVNPNQRITANCVQNLTNTDFSSCVRACVLEKKCVTLNHNELENICELLNISKFDALGLLKYGRHWNHYETDDDVTKVIISY